MWGFYRDRFRHAEGTTCCTTFNKIEAELTSNECAPILSVVVFVGEGKLLWRVWRTGEAHKCAALMRLCVNKPPLYHIPLRSLVDTPKWLSSSLNYDNQPLYMLFGDLARRRRPKRFCPLGRVAVPCAPHPGVPVLALARSVRYCLRVLASKTGSLYPYP